MQLTTEETKEYKELCECYNVKKCEHYRQYNYAQVSNGLKKLKQSQEKGIECIRIKNKPTEFNDCVYWTELHYPKFTAEKQLELIKLIGKIGCIDLVDMDRELDVQIVEIVIKLQNQLDHAKVKEILENDR